MTTELSRWKLMLDEAHDLSRAEQVMAEAMAQGSKEELLQFLGDLYREYMAPDPIGGCVGTLERMKRVYKELRSSEADLLAIEVDPKKLRAYLSHS